MKKYRLKKDLPGVSYGAIFKFDGNSKYKASVSIPAGSFNIDVDDPGKYPDWFEEIVDEVNPILWKPEKGQDYYYYTAGSFGDSLGSDEWGGRMIDHLRYNHGILYPNYVVGCRARNRQLTYMELIRAIARANGGWVADWGDGDQEKWCFDYDAGIGMVQAIYYKYLPPELYMESEEVAEQILQDLGEDKIKLAMGWE